MQERPGPYRFHMVQRYAPFASKPGETRGRLYPEAESQTRSPYQRDRDRIIHSSAFRRLKHKTQVFVYHEGDYYRTRLTHSIEVAQIARSISRVFGLNEDLAEALSLAHDFGHTPFGHAGEDALDAAMAPFGGFDHNAQSLRVVTRLEERYAEFQGLNLTWETLEGLAKHNGPLCQPGGARSLPIGISDYVREHDLELHTYAGAEAQVAAIADDIAYNNHDIEDGVRAGLFTLDDMIGVPLVAEVLATVDLAYPTLDKGRRIHETVRRLINHMVEDIIHETARRLEQLDPQTATDIRMADRPMVAFSDYMAEQDRLLKSFLKIHMYRHYKVNRMASKARRVVRELFDLYHAEPNCLPTEWFAKIDGLDETGRARVVADFIAGMTDSYALLEHKRLFDVSTFTL
ncbi:deoxyguanosinetriphosphate triphosphohydrolase [Govanella unica]|uniref:Deoxyguanosinetriphosphate triphosphohydrolase-like protein n=1 Tax=Govanella unica TaxID=2975056 RepID=A0A9X3TX71_9PROT|nr:deoxyguanosinetriphosphate triphosphohydrolase [Govania unica]MDA5193313.1 deoxyguanosinetriphosphate triphosphohydrolase [Govania unica]